MKRHSDKMGRATLSELNITPLLDLCFVLLIIFMITTPLMEQKMDINLPHARQQADQNQVDPKAIKQVAVNADGHIFYEKERVTVKELERILISLKSTHPDAAVALRADANLRYQQIVRVLDAIKESGVKLGLSTVADQ
jgi:biopolymer transport protein ExbD